MRTICLVILITTVLSCKGQENAGVNSCVNAIYDQNSANLAADNLKGGLMYYKYFKDDQSKYIETSCSVNIAQDENGLLHLATSHHCANFLYFESKNVKLKLFPKNTDNPLEFLYLEGALENSSFDLVQSIKESSEISNNDFKEKLIYTHVIEGNQGTGNCRNARLFIDPPNPSMTYTQACFSDQDTALVKVRLDSKSRDLFEQHFGLDYTKMETSELENINQKMTRHQSIKFLYHRVSSILTNPSNDLDYIYLTSEEAKSIGKFINDPNNEGFEQLYRDLLAEKDMGESAPSFVRVKMLFEESKQELDELRAQRRQRLMSINEPIIVSTNARTIDQIDNVSKNVFTSFNTGRGRVGETVEIDGGFYHISDDGSYVLGFNDSSPLRLEDGDSGSLVTVGNEILAVVTLLNGRDIQILSDSDLDPTDPNRIKEGDIDILNPPSSSSPSSSSSPAPTAKTEAQDPPSTVSDMNSGGSQDPNMGVPEIPDTTLPSGNEQPVIASNSQPQITRTQSSATVVDLNNRQSDYNYAGNCQ